jgi:hypothetical protein
MTKLNQKSKGVQIKVNHLDFDGIEIANDIIREIENDYGKKIARIPYFKRASEPFSFDIKIIFSDFKLLEGQIRIVPNYEIATVQVDGIYY